MAIWRRVGSTRGQSTAFMALQLEYLEMRRGRHIFEFPPKLPTFPGRNDDDERRATDDDHWIDPNTRHEVESRKRPTANKRKIHSRRLLSLSLSTRFRILLLQGAPLTPRNVRLRSPVALSTQSLALSTGGGSRQDPPRIVRGQYAARHDRTATAALFECCHATRPSLRASGISYSQLQTQPEVCLCRIGDGGGCQSSHANEQHSLSGSYPEDFKAE